MALDTNAVIPAHVALILDGNGRWAKKRGLPRTMGDNELIEQEIPAGFGFSNDYLEK